DAGLMSDWRYIAQRLPSGEWLDWDLPLAGVEILHELSGPGGLNGTVPVEVARLTGPDGLPVLLPWGCAIWAEASGEIRGGGILVRSEYAGAEWSLECVGIGGYPQGQAWLGKEYKGVQVDPLDIVRKIWDHLQGEPGGDLGVVLDDTTSPVTVGEPADPDDEGSEPDPFRLTPWDTADVGSVIDDLAASTPFDYVTHTTCAGDSEQLHHRLELAYPRRGSRRDDLRFVVGENVAVDPTQTMDGDDYASVVLGIGSGEGRDS